jgi:proteasome accessory factor C
MAKEMTTPLEQTARLLDLVPFLLSHQGIALTDLAKHFKVENEVMLDDLNTLWMCGLPGYTPLELIDLNFDSGFVTIRNAAPLARVRTMSSSEIVTLILGLDLLRGAATTISEESIKRIEKLSEKLRSLVGIDISIRDKSQTLFRTVLATAIKERRSVDISYYSPTADRESNRTITPYHFTTEGQVEYFQGYCHASESIRTFRLDRVRSAEISPREASVEDSSLPVSKKVRALAKVHSLDRSVVESFRLDISEVQGQENLTLEAFTEQWMVRSIMASGGGLEIQEPSEVRDAVAKSIEATMALYGEGAIALAP